MDENVEIQQDNHIELTTDIVASYISNNSVPPAGLAELITSVHGALVGLGTPTELTEPKVEKATAARIRRSITPDALISFEDGKPYKSLRRHLTKRGLSPDAYRAKHGLSSDYPMTSPGYSAKRSEIARSFGLGQRRRTEAPEAADVAEAVSDATTALDGGLKGSLDAEAVPQKAKSRGRPGKAAEATKAEQEG